MTTPQGAGPPTAISARPVTVDSLGMTIFGWVLPIWLEALILVAFGCAALGFAALNFRRRD